MRWLSVAILNTLNSHWHIWTFQANIHSFHSSPLFVAQKRLMLVHLLISRNWIFTNTTNGNSEFKKPCDLSQLFKIENLYLSFFYLCHEHWENILFSITYAVKKSGLQQYQECPFPKLLTFLELSPEMNLSWIWPAFYDLAMVNGELVLCYSSIPVNHFSILKWQREIILHSLLTLGKLFSPK